MVYAFGVVLGLMAQIEMEIAFLMIALCASFELLVSIEMICRLEGTSCCHGGGQGPVSHLCIFL